MCPVHTTWKTTDPTQLHGGQITLNPLQHVSSTSLLLFSAIFTYCVTCLVLMVQPSRLMTVGRMSAGCRAEEGREREGGGGTWMEKWKLKWGGLYISLKRALWVQKKPKALKQILRYAISHDHIMWYRIYYWSIFENNMIYWHSVHFIVLVWNQLSLNYKEAELCLMFY